MFDSARHLDKNRLENHVIQESVTSSGEAKSGIRVMLVEDHRSVLWGLRKLINGEAPRMVVVAEAICWKDALKGLRHDPDIILLDLDLGDENGLDMVTPMRQRSHAKIIILTGLRDSRLCEEAVMRGASGFVNKLESPEVILKAISHVHAGELWLEPHVVARVFAALSAKRDGRLAGSQAMELTDRERRIIAVVVKHRGAPAKVIADGLHISSNTLRNHLAIIYRKLGIHSRIDLILYAMRAGMDRDDGGTRRVLEEKELDTA